MKNFNKDFKEKLTKTIEDIENSSLIEIVAIVRPRSANYRDIPLWWGVVFMLLTFSVLMFIPFVFGDYTFYALVLFSFFAGLILAWLILPLQRPFIGKKRMERNVELLSRAIFQKGKLRNTNAKIGTLIFVSVFERKVCILADDGAKMSIPQDDWDNLNLQFNSIFKKSNPALALIEELKKAKEIFATYIPPIENDMNELPDDLEVDL
jgi:putative membrane protein